MFSFISIKKKYRNAPEKDPQEAINDVFKYLFENDLDPKIFQTRYSSEINDIKEFPFIGVRTKLRRSRGVDLYNHHLEITFKRIGNTKFERLLLAFEPYQYKSVSRMMVSDAKRNLRKETAKDHSSLTVYYTDTDGNTYYTTDTLKEFRENHISDLGISLNFFNKLVSHFYAIDESE